MIKKRDSTVTGSAPSLLTAIEAGALGIPADMALRQLKEKGALNTSFFPPAGNVSSSVATSRYFSDFNVNAEFYISKMTSAGDNFERSRTEVLRALNALKVDVGVLDADLKSLQISQHTPTATKVVSNFFASPVDLQFSPGNAAFLLQDPLTSASFNSRDTLSYLQDNGFTLPVDNSIAIPITTVTRDHAGCELGQLIISESEPQTLVEGNPYTITFLDRDRDNLGSVYKRRESYKLCLWFELGGLQEVNRLSLKTGLPCRVESISYLDQNENEVNISFQSFPSFGGVAVSFDKLISKAIKVVISTNVSLETSLFENEFGRSYCFHVSEVKVHLDIYRSLGYYLSKPVSAYGVKGSKLRLKYDRNSEFVLEQYLRIEEKSSGGLVRYRTIPLLEDYNVLSTFALYFVNQTAKLFFYPSDDIKVYKNGVELIVGTDYGFFTSKDSTLTSTVTEPESLGNVRCFIKITTFDATAVYTTSYTPRADVPTDGGYKYNGDTISLGSDKGGNFKMHLLLVLRKTSNSTTALPVIEGYTLELHNES